MKMRMSCREKQDGNLQRDRKQLSKTTLGPILSTWSRFPALVMDQSLISMTRRNLPLAPSTAAVGLHVGLTSESAVPGFRNLWLVVGNVWLVVGNVWLVVGNVWLVVGNVWLIVGGTLSSGSRDANFKATVCELMCGHLQE